MHFQMTKDWRVVNNEERAIVYFAPSGHYTAGFGLWLQPRPTEPHSSLLALLLVPPISKQASVSRRDEGYSQARQACLEKQVMWVPTRTSEASNPGLMLPEQEVFLSGHWAKGRWDDHHGHRVENPVRFY